MNDDGDWDDIEIPPHSMFFFPWDLEHAGLEFEDDNQAFHFFAAGPKLGNNLRSDAQYLDVTNDITYDESPKSAATTRDLEKRAREFDGDTGDAYALIDAVMVHEEGRDWFVESAQSGHDHSIHGTIGMTAFDRVVTELRRGGVTRGFLNVGAGKCHLMMMMRLLGIEAHGCEQVQEFVDRGNEIGRKYFSNWDDVPCIKFENFELPAAAANLVAYLIYVNNLAYGRQTADQKWLVDSVRQFAGNADNLVASTDVIPGLLGDKWEQTKVGRGKNIYGARHSNSAQTFTLHLYTVTAEEEEDESEDESEDEYLERYFNEKRPFGCYNGARSFNAVFYGQERLEPFPSQADDMTWEHCENTAPFNLDEGQLYEKLKNHKVICLHGPGQFEVRNAFQSDFKKQPSLFKMHKWVIDWCSVEVKTGSGFLELDNETTGMEIDCEAEYLMFVKQLERFGKVPLRRSGHPEYEFAHGYYLDSSFIRNDECFRLQVANACGEDVLSGGLQRVRDVNRTMDPEGYPSLNQLKVALSMDTPLDLEMCKDRTHKKSGKPFLIPGTEDPMPDLCGNLGAVLMRKEGMYLIETHWPGKRLGHLLLFDAERNYLMMGRCGATLKQTTLIPTGYDCLNPTERLKAEFGYDFTVGDVALIMLNTRKMEQVPLAAYDLGPEIIRARDIKAQKKRKAFEQRQANDAPVDDDELPAAKKTKATATDDIEHVQA